MAQTSEIIIDDIGVHPETGHISIRVRTHNKDGNAEWKGPLRTYGCDTGMFMTRFNGDIEQLKNWILSEHQAYTGAHLGFVGELMKMKGTSIKPVQNLDPKK